MIPDERDTIVALATTRGVGARGVVRVSGPRAIDVLAAITRGDWPLPKTAQRLASLAIEIELANRPRSLSVDALVWPNGRSYTRQPTVELHTPAAAPIVDAVVRACCGHGARLAQPGEFTLRAFLSGRIDLTQAEAVLGVIDAANDAALGDALGRLAGGLSTPLHQLREDLTQLLAELEAGLDFVDEEDIRFVEPEELTRRLEAARGVVATAIEQSERRGGDDGLPTVVLAGPPNAGKSRLFNAVRERWSDESGVADALVSDRAGTTRDTLTTTLAIDGVRFRLVDTAGIDESPQNGIAAAAEEQADASVRGATLVLRCSCEEVDQASAKHELFVETKCDQPRPSPGRQVGDAAARRLTASAGTVWRTSAVTGEGLEALMHGVVKELAEAEIAASASVAAGVSARCREALAASERALGRAMELAPSGADELVAEELRQALAALGDVVGATATDDLLDRIFGQFCIGK